MELHQVAVLAGDPVALGHGRSLLGDLRNSLELSGSRPDTDDGGDREAERLRVDLCVVAGDDPGALEALHALGHGRRRHPDPPTELRYPETAVGLQTVFQNRYNLDVPVTMAGMLLASLPMILLYLFGQRFFIRGLTAGAVKG
jgi:hypothetical protein